MVFRFLTFLLVAHLLFSCSPNEYQGVQNDLEQAMNQAGFAELLDKEFLLIVPRTGCMGCISSAESFMLEAQVTYANRLNILLTDISSYKTARVRFGESFMSADNVFIDRESVFNKGELNTLYPMIIQLSDGRVVGVSLVSPENEYALSNFQLALTEN